jgi:hypothetical protein
MSKTVISLRIDREADIDSLLRVFVDNGYRIYSKREITEKIGGVEIRSYFVVAEKNSN